MRNDFGQSRHQRIRHDIGNFVEVRFRGHIAETPIEARAPGMSAPRRIQPHDASIRVHDLQTATPGFSMVTGVRERSGTVWLGSLHSTAIAHFTLP